MTKISVSFEMQIKCYAGLSGIEDRMQTKSIRWQYNAEIEKNETEGKRKKILN